MADTADKTTTAIREAAAEWVVRLGTAEGTPIEESQFFEWLRRSPEHVKEYLRAEAAWLAMDGVARDDTSDVAGLMRDVSANIIPLSATQFANDGMKLSSPTPKRAPRARTLAAIAAGMVLALALLASTPRLVAHWQTPSYTTALGEQRRIVLDDGSTIELNTHSQVRVQLKQDRRTIFLDAGEALFTVAKDASRPFKVMSGATEVRAVGTQFNVYRQRGKITVTVLEGRVIANAQGAPVAQAVELAAGETIALPSHGRSPAREAKLARADTRAVTAWRERRLIFNDEPLGDVVVEFNRYNRQQLEIDDAHLAAERISGVFDADQPRALVRFLAQQSRVQATQLSDLRIVLTPARQ